MSENINKILIAQAQTMAELTCELSRLCQEKENYFASMFNITPAEFKCLKLFIKKKSQTLKEIKDALKLTPGRITHILTSLENKNFIKRSTDPNDHRNVNVNITPKCEPFLINISESHSKLHQEILERIDGTKREATLETMKEIIVALKAWLESRPKK